MNGKLINLKRSAASKAEMRKSSLGAGGGEDYPYGASFEVGGEHAQKMFGDKLPSRKTPVKFHGEGHVDSVGPDGLGGSKDDHSRVRIQMRKLCVDCQNGEGGDEAANGAGPKSKALRNTIKRSAKQVGEDLGDEEE